MEVIYLTANQQFTSTVEQLKKELESLIQTRMKEVFFANTEAALTEIIRGSIDYFATLDPDFLGSGNASGIPDMEADHFANNFYRISNTLDYLAKLWHMDKINKSKEWKLLEDIRTLIVHSGGQLTDIKSLDLKGYKDAQLGRIFRTKDDRFRTLPEDKNYDYYLTIWTDKQDSSKKRPENEVDYDEQNENYRDIDIYLNAEDVKQIILVQIELFISLARNRKLQIQKTKKLPTAVKEQVVSGIDFDKLEQLIRNKKRGGYFVENGIHYWDGFGLKRLWQHIEYRFNIPKEVRTEIQKVIQQRFDDYWIAYNNESADDYDLPSLDVRKVFKEYTPEYKFKHYLEGEKLFGYIAPSFNTKENSNLSDVDYLLKFINQANKALGTELNLESTVDGVVCDYFVKSVEKSLEAKKEHAR